MLILPFLIYYPSRSHYEYCTYDLIHTPSTNCTTSVMPLIGKMLYFYGQVTPPPLSKSYLSLSLFLDTISPSSFTIYFYLYLSSNSCITSTLSLLVTCHSFLSLSQSHSLLSLSNIYILTILYPLTITIIILSHP